METEIVEDAPCDYVVFRILPENRYEACLSSSEKEEMVGDGPLDQLLEHLPIVKSHITKGTLDYFKLELTKTIDHQWFTKATLKRFFRVIGSSGLKKALAIGNEMCQLEEARNFHLSLYTQADGSTSLDTSKNELVRAMESRIVALAEELALAINVPAKDDVSFEVIMDLQKCCQQFGDVKIRNLISKLWERNQISQIDSPLDKSELPGPFVSKNDFVGESSENIQVSNPVKNVKCIGSNGSVPGPESIAITQNYTESDESSFSSEDDRQPAERSRNLIRSPSLRRSASPMRKIQLGRSGSRRTPTLAIKCLPYFPPRERIPSHKDTGNDSDPEATEKSNKKAEGNVTRISVQDAICVFERNQRDGTVDSQKKSIDDISMKSNKSVLRRWSSGMGESQKALTHNKPEKTASELDKTMDEMGSRGNVELELILNDDRRQECQTDESDGKLDSVEWSKQKEAELNEMLMNFAQYNLSNHKNTESGKNNSHGDRKEGRNHIVGGETNGKKVQKQTGLRGKKKVLDKPKAEKSSAKVGDMGRKHITSRTLNINKSTPMTYSKTKSAKPDVSKKAPSKPSFLPATRKSWPHTPSVGGLETVSTSISTGIPSVSSVCRQKSQLPAPHQKPHPPASVSRSRPKVEKSWLQQKGVRKTLDETKKTSMKLDNSKECIPSKSGKITTTKTIMGPKKDAVADPVKAIVRKKGTKKSSVVPLEAKPPSCMVTETTPASSSLRNTDISVQAEQTLSMCDISVQAEQTLSKCENPVGISEDVGNISSDIVHPTEPDKESKTGNDELESEPKLEGEKPEQVFSSEANVQDGELGERWLDSQEPVISPAAWEEISQQDPTIPFGNGSSLWTPSSVNNDTVVTSSETRARHLLCQMLLDESSEQDIIEWGNAENPPAMIHQKDSPKGLKRLLKFKRKSKRQSNSSNSSPRSSSKRQDGHTSKGTRSFFSLSVFRGSKS